MMVIPKKILCVVVTMLITQPVATTQQCRVTENHGCYPDDNDNRILPFYATGVPPVSYKVPCSFGARWQTFHTSVNLLLLVRLTETFVFFFFSVFAQVVGSQEECAELCCAYGFTGSAGVAGVECSGQCFCAHSFHPGPGAEVPMAECGKQCSGNKSEVCGANNRIVVYSFACEGVCYAPPAPPQPKPPPPPSPMPPNVAPNWMPCEVEPAKSMPFCNHTLPTATRVANLISLMTQQELCSQTYDKMGLIAKVPSWQGYNWNTECLHGLGGICNTVNGTTRCPSIFAAPPALGATFNLTVAHDLGRIISNEIRAYSNSHGHRGYQNRPIGVSAWGPNLNIYRDPRWGRNVEVPSEDPFHSGQYGVSYTKGLQWGDDDRYTKAIGALKHYTIYSVENSGGHGAQRGSSYFAIAMRDIEDTYLPQFKAPVVEARSLGYMCSYAALTNPALHSDSTSHPHSEPCCASQFFAVTKMVDEYGFEGYVQSDCGAVQNELGGEHYAANASDAAAKAIVDGRMNSNCGSGLMQHACDAVAEGLMTQADLVARVTRSLTLLMNAGLFDPVALQTYTKIPFDTINSEAAQAANLEATRQSLVLLQNPTETATGLPLLPLAKGSRVALIGPHTQTQKDLAGNYFEDIGLGTCAGPTCVPTLKAAFDAVNGGNASIAAGCDMKCTSTSGFAAAEAVAAGADVVVLALGADGDICGEGNDRMNITLPGRQIDLAQNIIALGKPTVLLLFTGGLYDIGPLKHANIAIVQGWFPGATGGTAVAETIFGEQNRFGKLPFTYYASNFTACPTLTT
eukprot:m.769002 g.769002  ORF g.769002 m.769002 type:complete len:798 (-) comp23234_c0_seq1:921-3314(-)